MWAAHVDSWDIGGDLPDLPLPGPANRNSISSCLPQICDIKFVVLTHCPAGRWQVKVGASPPTEQIKARLRHPPIDRPGHPEAYRSPIPPPPPFFFFGSGDT